MSPHYIADPPRPVVVPKEQWHAALPVDHEDQEMSQGEARDSSDSVDVEGSVLILCCRNVNVTGFFSCPKADMLYLRHG